MDEALDLAGLTDDQIVQLAVALAREALRRSDSLGAAFERALLDEAERVASAARGSERAKLEAAKQIEQQAHRAEQALQKERMLARERLALGKYLVWVSEIAGRPVEQLTLVWIPDRYGRGGPQLMVNQGTAGEDASWHLVQYVHVSDSLHLSPGLRSKAQEIQAWARETCAAVWALGIQSTRVIKGVEI